jgi:hypothetical protein
MSGSPLPFLLKKGCSSFLSFSGSIKSSSAISAGLCESPGAYTALRVF